MTRLGNMKNLRNEARGRECQVRIPGVCNFDSDTTVLAHLGGAGMGRKSDDMHAAVCCSSCHDIVDGRKSCLYSNDEVELMFLQGVIRTQQLWISEGFM